MIGNNLHSQPLLKYYSSHTLTLHTSPSPSSIADFKMPPLQKKNSVHGSGWRIMIAHFRELTLNSVGHGWNRRAHMSLDYNIILLRRTLLFTS
jgi:hypothetical protein